MGVLGLLGVIRLETRWWNFKLFRWFIETSINCINISHQVVEKQLPITEKQIRTKVKSWEKANKTVFQVYDTPYIKYVENQKVEYRQLQEKKREAKRLAKQEELLAELEVRGPNAATKRMSVYDKEANEETLKELMKPTESSLLKSRNFPTPGAGFAPMSSISETSSARRIEEANEEDRHPPMRLSRLDMSTSAAGGSIEPGRRKPLGKSQSASKLGKLDTSTCANRTLNSSKIGRPPMSTSKSESRLPMMRNESLSRPTTASMMKTQQSRLPQKRTATLNTSTAAATSSLAPKRKVTLQTDPLKRKAQRRSLGAKRRSLSRKENTFVESDTEEGNF